MEIRETKEVFLFLSTRRSEGTWPFQPKRATRYPQASKDRMNQKCSSWINQRFDKKYPLWCQPKPEAGAKNAQDAEQIQMEAPRTVKELKFVKKLEGSEWEEGVKKIFSPQPHSCSSKNPLHAALAADPSTSLQPTLRRINFLPLSERYQAGGNSTESEIMQLLSKWTFRTQL